MFISVIGMSTYRSEQGKIINQSQKVIKEVKELNVCLLARAIVTDVSSANETTAISNNNINSFSIG